MIKEFDKWIWLKKKLHQIASKPPHASEGDIWWVSFGENIGSEVNGKSSLFSRPAIIFKRFTDEYYLVIPTTTKDKQGSWYVPVRCKGLETKVCLHQLRTIDYRRLSSRLGELNKKHLQDLKIGFQKLYC